MSRGNNETTRACPRAKIREEENMLDKSLSEAGLLEDGMTIDNKRLLVKMISDSKQTAEREEEMRRNSDIGLSNNQHDSLDDVVAMECDDNIANVTPNQGNVSPDLFEDTPETMYAIVTSPFNSSTASVVQTIVEDVDEAIEAKEIAENEIFQSDSDEDESIFGPNENIPPPSKHDEESTHSFKSAHDAIEVNSPSVKIVTNTEVPTSTHSKFELKSALKCDILKGIVKDEPEPFYKALLAQRPRSKYKQIPLFYDPALKMSKSQHLKRVEADLNRDTLMMARLVFKHKSYDTNKWASPVKECTERAIESLDKLKANHEPAECTILPWGAKPIVLDYIYNTKKGIKATFNHKMTTNRPGLSITKAVPGSSASSSSTSVAQTMTPTVTIKKITFQEIETYNVSSETEKSERPKREVVAKRDVYTFSEEENSDDDNKWVTKESQRGKTNRGKGHRGRGNAGNRGEGNNVNVGGGNVNHRKGGKGGKRGRGRPEGDRSQPALVGVHVTTAVRGNKGGASRGLNDMEIVDQLDHPALDETLATCPICSQQFPQHEIINHAASCVEFQPDNSRKW